MNTKRRFKVQRIGNITSRHEESPVFYEAHEVFTVDGEERAHRQADLAFQTRQEAEDWIRNQGFEIVD